MQNLSKSKQWDAIVVGGGAAGLSAALMLGRARRSVLIIDAGSPRNRFAAHMHGVLGHENTPPRELVQRGREEVASYGGQFLDAEVTGVDAAAHGVEVSLESGERHMARALIVATGITDRLPEIPGLAERWGISVFHCPYCHGWEVADARLGVLATSPMAVHQAQMVRQWSDRVTLFAGAGGIDDDVRERLVSRGVVVIDQEVTSVVGDGTAINAVTTADGAATPIDAIFTAPTVQTHDGFLATLNLEREESPFGAGSLISVDQVGKTSLDRIWAVGNVVNPMANVPMVIGAGAFTGAAVNGALIEEEFNLASVGGSE